MQKIFSLIFALLLASIILQSCSIQSKKSPILNVGNFTDVRDGQTYKWVRLKDGNIWMAENLNYETKDAFCFRDKQENCDNWGKLYHFGAALKACPSGWHLPSQAEWTKLLVTYGNPERLYNDNLGYEASKRAFQLFKAGGETGLDLIISGSKIILGYTTFEDGVTIGTYWSSTKVDAEHASYYEMNSKSARITRWNSLKIKHAAFSCRCVKNVE